LNSNKNRSWLQRRMSQMDGCAGAVCPEGGIHARINNGWAAVLTQVWCSRQGVTTPSLHTFILKWRI